LAPADGEGALPAEGKAIGDDPQTGLPVTLRNGRFGLFVQLGDGEKPKRGSIPKGWDPDTLDLERALKLLGLPREVGAHPEDGGMILANIGRYGPYIQLDKLYVNLPGVDDVFEIGLNRAVQLIADKRANPKGRFQRGAGGAPPALKELGPHPDDEAPIKVTSGRYGPYVGWNRVFATIPKDIKPEDVTREQALEWLAAKAAKGGGAKKPAKKTAAKKEAVPKKTPAKKAVKKEASPKKVPAKKAAPKKGAAKKNGKA
jgi:DNA topoisomerase-1